MLNNFSGNGRLTRDVELQYTNSNKEYARITIAIQRDYKNSNGEREADFISCLLWGAPAKYLAEYARKGDLISISGRLETSSYQNQNGQTVYRTDVVVSSVNILAQVNPNFGHTQIQNSAEQSYNEMEQIPDYMANAPVDLNADDLPF